MKYLIFFFANLFSMTLIGQFDEISWAITQNGQTEYERFTVDQDGNSFVVGKVLSTTDFDPSANAFWVNSSNGHDVIYIKKVDPNGKLIWVRSLAGNSKLNCNDIAIDQGGNVYITGGFYGAVDFDPGPAYFFLASGGNSDVFVLKLNSEGELIWAKNLWALGTDFGYSLDIDSENNVLLSGKYANEMDFDPGPDLFLLTPTFTFGSQGFLLKLDMNGEFLWAKNCIEFTEQKIEIDKDDNIYVFSSFQGVKITSNNDTLVSTGYSDLLIQKHALNGQLLWSRTIGCTKHDVAGDIASDRNGDIYLTGTFNGIMTYLSAPIKEILSALNSNDCYIIKLNSDGDYLWGRQVEGSNAIYGNSLSVHDEKIFVTGKFSGAAFLNPGPEMELFSTNSFSYNRDDFVLCLDDSGDFISALSFSAGSFGVEKNNIGNDKYGNLYLHLAAKFSFDLTFNSQDITHYLEGQGSSFLLKFGETPVENEKLSFHIYPNPTSGLLHVGQLNPSEFWYTLDRFSVEIYDQYGRKIREAESYEKNAILDLEELPIGIYFLHFIEGENRSIHEVLIR